MSRLALAPATLVSLLLHACGGGAGGGPPEILYGEDICDRCRMVISESRHAAGAVLDGREYRFDDPGCLLGFMRDGQNRAAAVAWVHEVDGGWLRVEEAWFVEDPELGTPMASGILAFGSAEDAAAARERYGTEPARWPDLLSR